MQTPTGNVYAIIPAAGRSRRMGRPKLLLPWPTPERPNGLLIDAVLDAWTSSHVDQTVIVVRPDDEALLAACRAWPVTVVCPETAPPDMKASVQLGFRHLELTNSANSEDRCFVAPADLPGLAADLINQLIACKSTDSSAKKQIVVPCFGEKTGHPALLPWLILAEIFGLSEDAGVNHIVARHEKHVVSFPAEMAFSDIDTPEEYKIARQQNG